MMKSLKWYAFIGLSVAIGLYPVMYLVLQEQHGVLQNRDLLNSTVWTWAFYQHVLFGGIAMLTGFSQFSKKLRNRNLRLHRNLGKAYLVAVLLSGTAGFYIAVLTFGGWPAQLGFVGLASGWLFTTAMAYKSILGKKADAHERWMIRSYSLTWAAVTLRLYLPLFEHGLGMNFQASYPIIAWLCWVPNLVVAELIIHSERRYLANKKAL
jgi:uncharacterized membrane protein